MPVCLSACLTGARRKLTAAIHRAKLKKMHSPVDDAYTSEYSRCVPAVRTHSPHMRTHHHTHHAHAMHAPCTRHAHAMHTRHAHAMCTPCARPLLRAPQA